VSRFLAPVALVAAVGAVGLAALGSVDDGRGSGGEGSGRTTASVVDLPFPELRAAGDIAPPGQRTAVALGVYPALRAPASFAFPSEGAIAAARRYLETRDGRASFAVLGDRGGLGGVDADRTYESASLVKAMILVAFLRLLDEEGRQPTELELARMDAMIRVSDNFSADDLYGDVGPDGLAEVAELAGMRDFAASSAFWGNSLVTAADQARLFLALDELVPREWRSYARGLLENVMPLHAWGIPETARPQWRVMFKGGWRPDDEEGQIVHQAALLERGSRRVAIAVLTDLNPGEVYGQQTIRGVTQRLLRAPRPAALAQDGTPLAPLRALEGRPTPAPSRLRDLGSG
jgi:hypothetical protein